MLFRNMWLYNFVAYCILYDTKVDRKYLGYLSTLDHFSPVVNTAKKNLKLIFRNF